MCMVRSQKSIGGVVEVALGNAPYGYLIFLNLFQWRLLSVKLLLVEFFWTRFDTLLIADNFLIINFPARFLNRHFPYFQQIFSLARGELCHDFLTVDG